MGKTKRLIWQCTDCKDVVISYSHKKGIDFCQCKKTAVDLEPQYEGSQGLEYREITREEITL